MLLCVKHNYFTLRRVVSFIIIGLSVATTTGCGRRVEFDNEQTGDTSQLSGVAVASAGLVATVRPNEPKKIQAEEGCGDEHHGAIQEPMERIEKDPKTGQIRTKVGQAFDLSKQRISVSQAINTPMDYAQKEVILEGEVTAMCSHRRAWYAIVDSSGKAPLRIIVAPHFLVPKDAMGKRSRVIGILESSEVPEQTARHLSKDHGLPEERRTTILRATGAEFY
jgi:hypothetical protein